MTHFRIRIVMTRSPTFIIVQSYIGSNAHRQEEIIGDRKLELYYGAGLNSGTETQFN